MKTTRPPLSIVHFQLSILLCAFCAFSCPPLLSAKDATPPTIKVASIRGKARYTTNITAKVWTPVERGTLLPANSLIQTAGSGSAVHLILEQKQHLGFDPSPSQRQSPFYIWTENTSILNVYESSVIAIDRFDSEKTKHRTLSHAHIDLRVGTILIDTSKLKSPADYQVTTTNSLVALTNGSYIVASSGIVCVQAGQADLTLIDKSGTHTQKTVPADFRYDPVTGNIGPFPRPTLIERPGIFDDAELFRPRPKLPTTPALRPGI
jgi:hypothetical protein